MATIHISLEEAERDLPSLVARLDQETRFLIENGSTPIAELRSPQPKRMTIDECIALLEAKEQVTQDDTFAEDIDTVVAMHREPLDSSLWDEE